jgi:pimeloyl-ACP methyl ester carboxylesterase
VTRDMPGRPAQTAMLIPGTGSDEVFVRTVFEGPLAEHGITLAAPAPVPGPGLAERHLAALDEAAADGPILAGGISLGAHLAAEWAVAHQDRCAGLLLAMPAWNGPMSDAPAGIAASASADVVDALGVDGALAEAGRETPDWLLAELDRAWRRHGAGLATSLRVAANHPAPTVATLRRITVPAGIATCTDDPVHPLAIARRWARALPSAVLRTTTLAEFGADRAALGRATVAALLEAVRVSSAR